MRRALGGLRWGGKWWCPRWLKGGRCGCSLLGVGISVWIGLVVVIHLSLQPILLLHSQENELQDSRDFKRIHLQDPYSDMGMLPKGDRRTLETAGIIYKGRKLPWAKDGAKKGIQLPAKAGPDQRVLLTNKDAFNEADDESALYEDELVLSKLDSLGEVSSFKEITMKTSHEGRDTFVRERETSPSSSTKEKILNTVDVTTEMSNSKLSETDTTKGRRSSTSSLGLSLYDVLGVTVSENAYETQLVRTPISRDAHKNIQLSVLPHFNRRQHPRHIMGVQCPRHSFHPCRDTRNVQGNSGHSVHGLHNSSGISQDLERNSSVRTRNQSLFRNIGGRTLARVTKNRSSLRRTPYQLSKSSQRIYNQTFPSSSLVDSSVLKRSSFRTLREESDDLKLHHSLRDPFLQSRPERAEAEPEDDVTYEKSRLKQDGFLLHAYNVTASDALPVYRQVPDTRPDGCPRQMPNVSDVGPVSVVICTHNEASSVLRRTVYSVFRQTQPFLLSDVIVVDDNSTIGDPVRALKVLGDDITQGKLRLLRTKGRQGLVRARLLGAGAATGKVLVFLDSHCECGRDWLPPLLHALQQDPKKIVSPYIDVIRSESFEFVRSPDNLQGAFNWRLEFGWRTIPLDDLTKRAGPHMPIKTAVISGGLFAVERKFFFELGAYDERMDIWGGENMELSFRVWMCGGQLEILPCSRVGHVFRGSVPYSFPGGDKRLTVLRNLARAAQVWMDDYRFIFFAAVNMTSTYDVGDMTSRIALRERLQCRSFGWYLNTVFSQLHVPSPRALHYGQFKNRGSLLCLTAVVSHPGEFPHLCLVACHGSDNQTAELLTTGRLRIGAHCVVTGTTSTPSGENQVFIMLSSSCQAEPDHGWVMQEGQLVLSTTNLCLTSIDNEFVRLQTCRNGDQFQQWESSYSFTWEK